MYKNLFPEIKIHPLFFIFLVLAIYYNKNIYFLLTFIVITIHECSHIFVASILGYKLKQIHILPIGERAVIDGIEEALPFEDILISLMGPLINIFFAMILRLCFWQWKDYDWVYYLFILNLLMGLFNLIPAFPMDGGRIFRTFLLLKWDPTHSNRISIIISRCFAFIFCIIGIKQVYVTGYNPSLLLTGIFIWINTTIEEKNFAFSMITQLQYKKKLLRRKGLIETKNIIALQSTPVSCVIKLFLIQRYHFVYVVNENMEVLGYIEEKDIYDKIEVKGYYAKIEEFL